MFRLLFCLLTCVFCINAANATTAWDESVSGDFANQGNSPTTVTLSMGQNVIRGLTGRSAGVVDRDYFSFTLPAGSQLDTLTVLPGTTFIGPSGVVFIATQAGPQVTVSPTGGSPTGLLGWLHYSENDLGTDILGLMGIGFGADGFTTPLPAGVYSFWIQDTATGSAAYGLDFGVSAVPELPTLVLLVAGFGALAWQTRERRKGVR